MDDQAVFHLQRRNLLIVSSLTLFYEIGDNNTGTSISLPFLNATVENTSSIEIFLHGTLLYFLWRYLVIFRAEGGIRNTLAPYFGNIIASMSHHAYKQAKQYLDQNHVEYKSINAKEFRSTRKQYYGIGVDPRNPTSKGALYRFAYITIDNNRSETHEVDKDFTVKGMRLQWMKITILIKQTFFTNMFLEYYFPFMFAFIALFQTLNITDISPVAKLLAW